MLRSGTVISVNSDNLTLAITRLPDEVKDVITVKLPTDLPIIEIRVPSFMAPSLRKKLVNGGIVIERVTVPLTNIQPDMKLDVISKEDMYCQDTVQPERLEYQVTINTEDLP